MNKTVTIGKRYLKDGVWYDDRGEIALSPTGWDPPMTDEEVLTAANSDPDCPPSTPEQLAQFRRVPVVKRLRWKLGISQVAFAERYRIPVGTIRDWEQSRVEPDAAALAYLAVIEAEPEMAAKAVARERPSAVVEVR